MPVSINQALSDAYQKLAKTSPTPRLNAEVLLAHVLGKNREYLLTYPEKKLSKKLVTSYQLLITRRLKHEPVAYITSHKEFYGLDFKVTPDTLIPRPETEHLVGAVINNQKLVTIKKNQKTIIIDVGTGSGNIIISIAKNFLNFCHSRENGNPVNNFKVSTLDSRVRGNDIHFYGTDISEKALHIARFNAKKHALEKKIKFLKGNLLEPILKNKNYFLKIENCKLIIVSNLPYLSKEIYKKTSLDIQNFEPKNALVSNFQGLEHYKKLFKQIKEIKKYYSIINIQCLIEFSPEQKILLQKIVKKDFLQGHPTFQKDLSGRWRTCQFEA